MSKTFKIECVFSGMTIESMEYEIDIGSTWRYRLFPFANR